MKVSSVHHFLILIITIVWALLLPAQIKWNFNTEGGVFRSKSSSLSTSGNLLLRVDGNLNYLYVEDDMSASAKLRVRPEFYGFENAIRSIKYKVTGDYNKKEDNLNWGISLTWQKNDYHTSTTELNYNNFIIVINTDWFEIDDYPAFLQLGYAYQTASENIEQNLDILFFDGKISNTLFPNNSSGLGIYIERFSVINKFMRILDDYESINSGWRYGPQISFEYLENIILSFEYRFLLHSSQVTIHPSNEHWLRLLAGKIFSDKWSMFLLADYYNRRFTFKKESPFKTLLLYNPLDNVNRVNLKLAYEVDDGFEIYLKSGYFKENFINTQINFDGWNILLGFEVND